MAWNGPVFALLFPLLPHALGMAPGTWTGRRPRAGRIVAVEAPPPAGFVWGSAVDELRQLASSAKATPINGANDMSDDPAQAANKASVPRLQGQRATRMERRGRGGPSSRGTKPRGRARGGRAAGGRGGKTASSGRGGRAGSGRGGSPSIASLKRARSSVEVTHLVQQLKPSTAKEFTVCISAYGRTRDWRSAVSLLGEMRRVGVEPNLFSYSAAISACAKDAQWERALSLLEEMPQRGIEPDVICFSAAITACEKGRQWERAVALLEEMQGRGVQPDVICFNSAISAFEKGGQWERALELLETMQRRGVAPDVISFNAAIQACTTAGQPVPAMRLFERLEASDLNGDVVSFNAILDALSSQLGRARALWKLGCARGCYRGYEQWGSAPALDLHDLSEGAAETAVRWWLEEGVPDRIAAAALGAAPKRLELITGWGKSREVAQVADVRARIEAVLLELGAKMLPTRNPGMLVVDAERWFAPPGRIPALVYGGCWRCWRCWRWVGKAWQLVGREAEARGVTRVLWSAVLRTWTRIRSSGVACAAGGLWVRTTIPRRWSELMRRSIFQARMVHARRASGAPKPTATSL